MNKEINIKRVEEKDVSKLQEISKKNISAINFYLKNDFEKFDQHIFRLGDDEQIDYMMRLKL